MKKRRKIFFTALAWPCLPKRDKFASSKSQMKKDPTKKALFAAKKGEMREGINQIIGWS